MPNWCSTIYKCVGDLKEIKSLHKILKQIDRRKTSIVENSFGKWWLGNLVTKLGGDWNKYRCRGEILEYNLDGNVLTIYQSTAWSEQEGVREIIEKTFPSIKVYYRDEESGCGVFCTNDTTGDYFPERYYLDSSNADSDYFANIEEAAKYVSDIVCKTVEPYMESIQKALDEYVEQQDDEDMWYSFHEFKIYQ